MKANPLSGKNDAEGTRFLENASTLARVEYGWRFPHEWIKSYSRPPASYPDLMATVYDKLNEIGKKPFMRFNVPRHHRYRLPVLLIALAVLLLLAGTRAARASECNFSTVEGARICSRELATPRFTEPARPADSIITGIAYGWVEDYAYFYAAPRRGARHVRTATTGFFYGPVENEVVDDEGNQWYKVWDYWLPARYYHQVEDSDFGGIEVNRTPYRPFGWILYPFTPRPAPAAPAAPTATELQRYHLIEIYDATLGSDGALWYKIGPERWVRHHAVALVTVRQPPDAVDPGEYWVDVDLSQQTFAAYEGKRMVYAGLISSGLSRWETRTGLNQVWSRHETTPMSGGVAGDDYYYIEDVPHTLYFDGETALHGAYWHDDFGRPKSHGCVNMAPRTAEWVFYWSEDAPNDLWVWVHNSYHSEFIP